MILTVFENVKSPDPLMDEKLNSKTHLQKPIFGFSSPFVSFWLQSSQKLLIGPNFFFSSQQFNMGIKNADFDADFEFELFPTEIKDEKQEFINLYENNFFKERFVIFELSVQFCFFILRLHLVRKNFWGSYKYILQTAKWYCTLSFM
jgi:hypothetical protein